MAIQSQHVQFGQSSSIWNETLASPEKTAEWVKEWNRSILEEYITQVREEVEPVTYQAFELVVRAGWKPLDVGSQLGITVRAVYNAKHRILKRIRELRDQHENAVFEGAVCIAEADKN